MKRFQTLSRLAMAGVLLVCGYSNAFALECDNWQAAHPTWVWCDDFENDASLESSYFEVDRAGGRFGVSREAAYSGTGALRAAYAQGQEMAGNVKLSIGRTPVQPKLQPTRDFTDVYWRVYMKTAPGWRGNATKMSLGAILHTSSWIEAAVGNVWEDSATGLSLGLDPVSGVTGSTVISTKFNDWANLKWLGHQSATTQVYAPANVNKWFCVEARMKLNTPNQSDGVFSLWIDDKLEADRTGLNFRGGYTQYGINTIWLINWINNGAPQAQVRYMDSFVVSTTRIGCSGSSVKPNAPTNVIAN